MNLAKYVSFTISPWLCRYFHWLENIQGQTSWNSNDVHQYSVSFGRVEKIRLTYLTRMKWMLLKLSFLKQQTLKLSSKRYDLLSDLGRIGSIWTFPVPRRQTPTWKSNTLLFCYFILCMPALFFKIVLFSFFFRYDISFLSLQFTI